MMGRESKRSEDGLRERLPPPRRRFMGSDLPARWRYVNNALVLSLSPKITAAGLIPARLFRVTVI
jgi:hypothetical protein